MVSDAQGPRIEGGQSVWTCMTNNSLIDDGFTAGEPRVCANLSLGVSIRSEFDGSKNVAVMVSLSRKRVLPLLQGATRPRRG